VRLFTGWDAAAVAIRASRLGAFRYLPKPGDLRPTALAPLRRAIDVAAGLARRPAGDDAPPVRDEDELQGKGEPMRAVHWRIGEAAGHDRPVLLAGEVGTGKGRAARAMHRYSARADRPLLHVNCLAFADDTGLDDRLFGCEPGRPGVFEQADGGAVSLDHFHHLSMPSQARLAELIRDRIVYRNGRGASPHPVQARLLACSSEDLPAALGQGRLYWELYSLLVRVHGPRVTAVQLRGSQKAVCRSSARCGLGLARVGRGVRSRIDFNASLPRRVGPPRAEDFGLRAEVGTTGAENASTRIHVGVADRSEQERAGTVLCREQSRRRYSSTATHGPARHLSQVS
jgi:hypothetical protein